MRALFLTTFLTASAFLASCTDSESNAGNDNTTKNLLDSAKNLAAKAQDALGKVKDLDVSQLSSMSPEKMQELGKSAMAAVATQLDQVKDLASAEKAKGTIDPLLEKLAALKGALAGQIPDASKITEAIQGLQTRLGSNLDVMNALQPLLGKLQGLIGG
ncbi:MAG: hypothetical protein JNM84_04455 [Planctomycetes bacterium]|nr:hypothetical protein [Planctomycetota bacterium]